MRNIALPRPFGAPIAALGLAAIGYACSDSQSPEAAPVIALSGAALEFSSLQLAANPVAQTIQISNTGGGTLQWSITDNADWVELSPVSGTGPGTVSIAVNTAGLSAGTHLATLTVSSTGASNTPVTASITLALEEAPRIVLSATTVSFNATEGGGDPAPHPIALSNGGGGTLDWTVTDDADWLTVTPSSGSGAATLAAAAAISDLEAGAYEGTVTISAPGSSNTPAIMVVNLSIAPQQQIVLSSGFLFVETAIGDPIPKTESVELTFFPSVPVSIGSSPWTATATSNRITVSPTAGTSAATLTIAMNSAGLTSGTYVDTVRVDAPGATNTPQYIRVTQLASSPYLRASPCCPDFDAVEGGEKPSNQTTTLTTNLSSLNWTAVSDESWLTVSPTSGTAPAELTLAVDNTGLTSFFQSSRTYFGNITITTDRSEVTSSTIFVSLRIHPRPFIILSPTSLFFSAVEGGPAPTPLTFDVDNGGTGTFSWAATKNSSWLSFAPASGESGTTVTVSPNTAGLTAESPTTLRSYRDTIVVSAGGISNSPVRLPVLLQITPPPRIAVLDTPVTLAATTGSATATTNTFRVRNDGGGDLPWTITGGAPWLSVSPSTHTTGAGFNSTVTASASAAELSPGTYEATLAIESASAANSPQNARVVFTVAPVYDGNWAGRTTPVDTTISFTITNNGITNISFGWGGIAACGGVVSGNTNSTFTTPIDVRSGSFTSTVGGNPITYTITGDFSSPAVASGSLTYNFSAPCGSGARTVTWSATRQ